MKQHGFQAAEPKPLETSRTRRARGYHRPGRLLAVALLMMLAFVSFVAVLAGIAGMIFTEVREWGWLALGGMAVFVITRVTAFSLSAHLTCPLCHGTVMLEKRCRKHDQAFRLPLLSYRASAVLSLLTTGSFRCMYCGTPWRLRRTSHESMQ